ncbi:hypothetical protein [Desulfonema limicola]|nr:hypothetical protein [Desulfonema limicola]
MNRLSKYEQELMFWLAILREPVQLSKLKDYILRPQARESLSSTIQSLQRRMTIESSAEGFSLQPVLMEYLVERLISEVFEEIRTEKLNLLHTHPLITARAKDYRAYA